MQYKTLGDTGLLVSTLCFGTMTFHGGTGLFRAIGTVDQAGADQLVKASIDAGINFFDTADVYSEGESEKALGQSLKNLSIPRHEVIIATKVFGRTGPGRNDVGASRGHIMDAVEASLQRLQTDHIDLYQIHGNDSITPIDETLRALDTLVQQGKVRYIGCSNWQAWKIAKALGISEFKNLARFDTLQAYYSIAGRDLERDIVPLLEAEKTGPPRLEPTSRRSPLRQVLPRKPEARRLPPLRVRLPHRRQRTHLAHPRRHGPHRQSPQLQSRPHLPRLAARQTRRHLHHHRSQTPRPA
jgi:aryl-alcohol dehydrogenase-like predicted oxidoreductase